MSSPRPILLAAMLVTVALPGPPLYSAATPAPAVESEAVVPSEQLDTKARVRTQVPPQFPLRLRGKISEGSAKVAFTVTAKGRVTDATVVEASAPEFGAEAIAAVQKWRFDPATKNGQPVASRLQVPLGFRFDDGSTSDRSTARASGPKIPSQPTPEVLAGVLRFDALDQKPRPRRQVPPLYPFELKSRGLEGRVVMQVVIGVTGDVEAAWPAEADHPEFAPAAFEAVRQWKFTPGLKDGKPVKCLMQIPIGFRLGG